MTDQSVTLNYLIREFQAIADFHEDLDFFGYGNFLHIVQSDSVTYKCMLMNVSNVSISEQYYSYSVELMIADKVFKDTSDRDNVESDTLAILGDVYSIITKADRWTDFCTVTASGQMRKFINKGEDQITGWGLTLTVNVLRKNGICDLPMGDYDYEGEYSAYCAPVNIDINSQQFLTNVTTNQDIPVKSENGDNVGGEVAGEWIIPDSNVSNSDDTYSVNVDSTDSLELPDITHTDSDGSPVTLPAQTPLVCTPNEPVNTANIIKTGQTTSTYAGDDGDNQFGRLTNFTTLEGSASDYPHNSLNRFCDLDGLQVYGNDIVVDMSTWNQLTGEVLMWYRIPSANIQGDTAISDAQTQTYGTFTNWFVPNVRQLDYIFDWDITGGNTRAWNYAPFNINQSSVPELWTSTGSELAGRLMTIQSNENRLRRFTTQTNVKYIPCRVGNISECNF